MIIRKDLHRLTAKHSHVCAKLVKPVLDALWEIAACRLQNDKTFTIPGLVNLRLRAPATNEFAIHQASNEEADVKQNYNKLTPQMCVFQNSFMVKYFLLF